MLSARYSRSLTIRSLHPWPQCQNGTQPVGEPANSNVSKILPLTTFRTIDLAGRKNSDPLFSRFCAKTRVFLKVFLHQNLCNPRESRPRPDRHDRRQPRTKTDTPARTPPSGQMRAGLDLPRQD